MELGGLVRKYREALGLSQAELGRAVGVSQATIDKIESGRTTLSRFMPRIAARLGIPQRDLDPFIGAPPRQPELRGADADESREYGDLRRGRPEEESLHATGRRREDMARRDEEALRRSRPAAVRGDPNKPSLTAPSAETDLPVYVADVDAFPIDWVKRPPPLANVVGAYGFLVKDSAMEPEFWPGDVALVHPHLPPGPQSACVFRTEAPPGEAHTQLKHLVSVDAAVWHVRQWGPPQGMKREFTLSRKEWPICHRVVGKYSRGWG
jgi:transcriptional regulator with XRE-family HTH domain